MEKIKKTILQAVTTGTTQGFWNAKINDPNIIILANKGDMWKVGVSGLTVLGDINEWNVDDWVVKYDDGDDDWGKIVNDIEGSCDNVMIIPNLATIYYMTVGLKQVGQDIGFFDAVSDTDSE